MKCTIRAAALADAIALPQVEFSAGRRFLTIPELAWLAGGDDMPIEAHQRYIALGTEWVALDEKQNLVGFLAAEIVNRDLHIWEIAVREDFQNRGIGRQLIDAATAFAQEQHLESLTLTTFENVPWNAPWYSRLGFKMSSGDERLAAIVRTETGRGWPQRCAMRKTIDGAQDLNSIALSVGESPEIEAFLTDRGGRAFSDRGESGFLPGQYSNRRTEDP